MTLQTNVRTDGGGGGGGAGGGSQYLCFFSEKHGDKEYQHHMLL